MNLRLKKLVCTVTLALIVVGVLASAVKASLSLQSTGREIDLFTQKEPYSGRGPNSTSDSFGPGEEVIIYAQIQYNGFPLQGIPVAFAVIGPINAVENITFARTANSTDEGIAMINFSISYDAVTNFGIWTVIGNAEIAGQTVNDTVSFRIGWIVQIVSIVTINENLVEQENFTRDGYVGIQLTLQSIAMTEKNVTISWTIRDSMNQYVNSTEITDFLVPPNETLAYVNTFLYIPRTAHLGEATIHASTLTKPVASGGVPYSPEVTENFTITMQRYFLSVKTEPPSVTTIPGEGLYEENTNVTLAAPIFMSISANLGYNFVRWDVDGFSQGDGVNAIVVMMDSNHTATAHYTETISYTLTIVATSGGTTNPAPGSHTYAANLTVQVTATADANYLLDHWELDGVNVGSANPFDALMDRNHTLKAVFSPAPAAGFPPYWTWFYWLLWPLLAVIVLLLILWYYRRRREKENEQSFLSGWRAWYYYHNVPDKSKKT